VNLYYKGNILYSYGTHFPLAIRYHKATEIPEGSEGFGCGIQYLVNGDKNSVTTSRHQNQAIGTLTPNVQIPFSALAEAWNWKLESTIYYKEWGQDYTEAEARKLEGIGEGSAWNSLYQAGWGSKGNPDWVNRANALAEKLASGEGGEQGFRIVNYRKDTWEYQCQEEKTGKPLTTWMDSDSAAWKAHTCQKDIPTRDQARHRLGAVLFTIRGNSFLSSFDEQDTRNYFLCQVPGSPGTVEEAYENLKPTEVKLAEIEGIPVLRQGDWFFIAAIKEAHIPSPARSPRTKHYRLGGNLGGTFRPHMVNEAITTNTVADFVRGFVRHSPTDGRSPEHRRLKLGDGKSWWVPVKNTSEAGWGAVGNVD
jgi:hypothetical protein